MVIYPEESSSTSLVDELIVLIIQQSGFFFFFFLSLTVTIGYWFKALVTNKEFQCSSLKNPLFGVRDRFARSQRKKVSSSFTPTLFFFPKKYIVLNHTRLVIFQKEEYHSLLCYTFRESF